jgi:subtilase family serine protease
MIALAAAASASSASIRMARVGVRPRLPRDSVVLGVLPAARTLRLTIQLEPRDPAGLATAVTATSTPGSPAFHRYLTVAGFAARFGAAAAAVSAVRETLREDGLSVGASGADDLSIPVTGSVASVDRAFDVSEVRAHLDGGRTVFLEDRSPVLPGRIAGYVQAVAGLDDVSTLQPAWVAGRERRRSPGHALAHALDGGPAPCAAATAVAAAPNSVGAVNGAGQGYTADEIASMYGLSSYYPGDEGAGQTVALIEFEPYQGSDVAAFQSCYQTAASVQTVDVDRGAGTYSAGDDDGESTLDIDQVIGLAPQAAVLVYEAPNAGDVPVFDAIASEDRAKVVSDSWSQCEPQLDPDEAAAENTALEEMAVQGQTFFAASGDEGSTACYDDTVPVETAQDESLSVDDPASQPDATGVGGTELGSMDDDAWSLPDTGVYPGESAWNDGGADAEGDPTGGSGGGVSDLWAMPAYQSGAAAGLGIVQAGSRQGCTGYCREVPDVSADADASSGYAVYSNGGSAGGGWQITGGTSASAPLWAAFTALADASPACRGLTLGFANPALYQLAGSAYGTYFHDVNAPSALLGGASPGNDTWLGTDPANSGALYPVGTGYDMVTGLGTPIAGTLGPALCALAAPVYRVDVTSPGAQLSRTGHAVSLQVAGADSGSAPLAYTASGLPAGLAMSAGGEITGTPTTDQTTTVTVTASDHYTNTGSTSFTWQVVTPGAPTLSPASLSGLRADRPRLSVTASAGRYAPSLASLLVELPRPLSLASASRAVRRGVQIRGVGFSATLLKHRTAVRIAFATPVGVARLSLGYPAIGIRPSWAKKILRRRTRLVFGVWATDAAGTTTRWSLTVR